MVSAEWRQPAANCSTGSQYACGSEDISTWIGIGGYCNTGCSGSPTDLIQVGTIYLWGSNGPYVRAFYQLAANGPVYEEDLGISPGDRIAALIYWTSTSPNGVQNWQISITDTTTRNTFNQTEQCDGGSDCPYTGFSTADFITESPDTEQSGEVATVTPQFNQTPFWSPLFNWNNYIAKGSNQNNLYRLYAYWLKSPSGPGYCSSSWSTGDYICQTGILASCIFGSGDNSVFYTQFLVDTADIGTSGCDSGLSYGGITGSGPYTVTGGISNPSSYDLTDSSSDFGWGGLNAINVGLEAGIFNAGEPGTNTLSLPSGANPTFGVFDTQNGYTYISDTGTNQVSIFNQWGTLEGTVAVGSAPLFPAYDPINGFVYVPNSGGSTVSVIYGTSILSSVPNGITVGTNPHSVEFDPTNGCLYVANYGTGSSNSNLTFISGTKAHGSSIAVGFGPLFAVPIKGYLYVPNSAASTVSMVAVSSTSCAATSTTTLSLTLGSDPHTAIYDPADGNVYIPEETTSSSTGYVAYGAVGSSSLAYISVGKYPLFGAYDPNDQYVYVTMYGGHTVYALSNGGVVSGGAISLSSYYPVYVVYDPTTSLMYTSVDSTIVGVIGGPSGTKEIGEVGVGSSPWGLTYDPANGQVVVMTKGASAVTVVDPLHPGSANMCWDTADETLVSSQTLSFYTSGNPLPSTGLKLCSGLAGGNYYVYQLRLESPTAFTMSNTTWSSADDIYLAVG